MAMDAFYAPTITVPIANHDNNQHSLNENIRLQNLRRHRADGDVVSGVVAGSGSWR